MRQKLFIIFAVVLACCGILTAQHAKTSHERGSLSALALSNIEALAGDEGDAEEVKCYCKTNWFSSNVCSANASGAYCGGDPCSNHDGNCR